MPLFALMAVGVDRPGNAAAVAGVLVEQGRNLEDTEVAVLRGHSAMMLVVDCPGPLSAREVKAAVVEAPRGSGLDVTVCEMNPDTPEPAEDAGVRWSVSVYGS